MNDYKKDGLLFCGVCQSQKEQIFEVLGKKMTFRHMCKCEEQEAERIAEEQARKEWESKIRRMQAIGFSDDVIRRHTFAQDAGDNPELTRLCMQYVEKFDDKKEIPGLLLYGTVGSGKTFMAACILNALIYKGHPCLATNIATVVNGLQATLEKQAYLDKLNSFDLVLIDDLGSERNSDYMTECVYNIVDARYRTGKPIIITTNLTGEELRGAQDMSKKRIYSRLLEMCLPVEVKGFDRRKEKLKAHYGAVMQLYE